ncbi:Transcriptional regulator, XRE family [Brachybacterium faecium]|nr:Transcriptional regulator, XRE family [Brachybacterium faecium]
MILLKINKIEVVNRIKFIRKSLGKTMEQFAFLTDSANTSAVNNWERGYNLPNKTKLKKIAILGICSVDWIKWGTLEEYISSYLIDLGYGNFITDYPEVIHHIFLEIRNNYKDTYQIDDDYELLNIIIKNTFKRFDSSIFHDYINNIVTNVVNEKVENYSNKSHSITKERFKNRFNSNFFEQLS